MKTRIMNFAQNQMGTAHLEAESPAALLTSILGKFIQCIAMTRFPIGSNLRCKLERLRGVKIGKHVFLGGGNVLDRAVPGLITIEDYVSLALLSVAVPIVSQ